MSNKRLLILGAGGHGKAVAEAALLSRSWSSIVFADDQWPTATKFVGCEVVSSIKNFVTQVEGVDSVIAAVGNNGLREAWLQRAEAAGFHIATVVHPSASVSQFAEIKPGAAVLALAMVGVGAMVGYGGIVNAHCTVDHNVHLGDFAHLGVGVHLAGGVVVGSRAWLQAGSCAGYGVSVADGAIHPPGHILSK